MDKETPQSTFPNVILSAADQQSIVSTCLKFKKQASDAWRPRKEKMRRSYAYYQGKHSDGDLLPQPAAQGNEKDANTGRVRVFLPVAKQIAVQLYSGMKLSLFPDDENYFTIRSNSGMYESIEQDMTRAVEMKLKKSEFTEKYGQIIQNLIIFGCSVGQPRLLKDTVHEWSYNDFESKWDLYESKVPQLLDIQVMNPIQFFPDPSMQWCDKSKWVYLDNKKRQEILDQSFYFNKEEVKALKLEETRTAEKTGEFPDLSYYSGLTQQFTDTETNVKYDLYYFPIIEVDKKTYRNFLCGIVEDKILVRFQPNPYPRGMNPVVFTTWRPDPHSPIGDGPLDDIQEIQKMINIYENYKIDTMATTGNKYVISPEVDMSQAFGAASTVIIADNPTSDVVAISGNMMETQLIQNSQGVLKAEAQMLTGSNQPFQGSSTLDFKKTATELNIIKQNSVSISREIIEHIAITGVKPMIERCCYVLAGQEQPEESFRVSEDDKGTSNFSVDFRLFLSGDFCIEVSTVNPTHSKQAQADMLMKVLEMMNSGGGLAPWVRDGGYQALKLLGENQGLRQMKEIFYSPQEMEQIQQQQAMAEQQAMQQAAMQGGMVA
jgi:hypothetical protein